MKMITSCTAFILALGLVACDSNQDTVEATDEPAAGQAAPQSEPRSQGDLIDQRNDEGLTAILQGEHRSEANRERDRYRNPAETLFFFEISPSDRVIEVNPGGGWYMEILGPLLNDEGLYIAATPNPEIEDLPEYFINHAQAIQQRIDEQSDLFGNGQVQFYDPQQPVLGESNSADAVLTFRNLHGWINGGQAQAMFEAFADVLKPGGVLGVVQHRAEDGAEAEESAQSGYVPEAAVIELAEAAGLELDARSNINANPNDTRDHPRGVWTLPPSLALGDENRDEYLEVGESDRMTLRFVKPE